MNQVIIDNVKEQLGYIREHLANVSKVEEVESIGFDVSVLDGLISILGEKEDKSDNDSIYIVTLNDYDRDEIVGYFTSYEEAENCRQYLDMTEPSEYDAGWCIEEFGHDTTDYASKLTLAKEAKLEMDKELEEVTRQYELAELARLKAKYEGV